LAEVEVAVERDCLIVDRIDDHRSCSEVAAAAGGAGECVVATFIAIVRGRPARVLAVGPDTSPPL
jgi:hypothetical protein